MISSTIDKLHGQILVRNVEEKQWRTDLSLLLSLLPLKAFHLLIMVRLSIQLRRRKWLENGKIRSQWHFVRTKVSRRLNRETALCGFLLLLTAIVLCISLL
jgi:hypothetical protein